MLGTGCIKDVAPSDAITTAVLTGSTDGLTKAVNGAYALFKDHVTFNGTSDDNLMYLRQYFQMSDFASDDFVCAPGNGRSALSKFHAWSHTDADQCEVFLVYIV